MIKLCVFDFDSTLVCEETIDELAKAYGVGEDVKNITKSAMGGGASFFESLQQRVACLRGMDVNLTKEVCANLTPTKGAKELIDFLKKNDIISIVFSGGFYFATDYFKDILGYQESFANHLEVTNGKLTGRVWGQMLSDDAKGLMLLKLKNIMNIKTNEILSIGDGANDISMFEQSGIKIAFCAKKILQERADICLNKRDLGQIIQIIQETKRK